MTDQDASDPTNLSPQQFAQFVATADDDQIVDTIRQIGVDTVLDRIFSGMRDSFRPDKAVGVEADVQWIVTDQKAEHPYTVKINDGSCEVAAGRVDKPKVKLKAELLHFVKLITGQADGMRLFLTRKLRMSGDIMFAQKMMSFFDRPSAE